jgi:hypothetical protein
VYKGRREFRAGVAITLLNIAATALFIAVAIVTYRVRGWNWVTIGMAGAVVVGILGIFESLVVRIQLTDDTMIVTDLRGRRRYPVTEIERIEEAKGVPAALLLKEGRWVKLPSVGNSLGNSVRAWLKRA